MHLTRISLAALTIALVAGCGSSEEAADNSPAAVCSRFGDNVEAYDILQPGTSRSEYLTLLHKLQRDCPDEAASRGLTNEGAPQCAQLDQENCTMYQRP